MADIVEEKEEVQPDEKPSLRWELENRYLDNKPPASFWAEMRDAKFRALEKKREPTNESL